MTIVHMTGRSPAGHFADSADPSPRDEWKLGDFAVLVLPILGLLKIRLVGDLYVHELVLLLILPLLLLSKERRSPLGGAPLFVFLGTLAWLLAQVVSDWHNGTTMENSMRGAARVVFFSCSFLSLVLLMNTVRRAALWFIASAAPLMLRPFLIFESTSDLYVIWKFGIGAGVVTLLSARFVLFFAASSNQAATLRRLAAIHMAFGIACLFLNSRSLAGISAMTGLLLLFSSRNRHTWVSPVQMTVLSLVALGAAAVFLFAYAFAAEAGWLGEVAFRKFQQQSIDGGSWLSVLAGGRPEFLVSTQAIADAPWLGHGSWPRDYKYISLMIDYSRAFNPDVNVDAQISVLDGLIPGHSFILGAWVESGIVGALFWISVALLVLVRVLPAAIFRSDTVGLLALLAICGFLWNLLFSPFGANVRVEVAGTLAIFMMCLRAHTPLR